jgi:RND family efflux transporter MFP subunit
MRYTTTRVFPLLVVMVQSVLLSVGCGQEEVQEKSYIRPVKAMQLSNELELGQAWFPGRAKAHQQVELSFRVSGPLVARPVNVGDRVKKGQLVARIDPRDFEVDVRNVRGRLERAKATMIRAKSDFRRVSNIMREDPGAVSEALLDQKRGDYDAAVAEVRSLEAELDSAKDQLRYTYLKAPFDGTVVATYIESFEDVRAKQRIVRILDSDLIEVIIDIPESMISLSPYVKNLFVEFDAFPGRHVPAKIYEIGTEASQTTRTYPVTLIMEQPKDFTILPGMAAKATGEAHPPEEVMTQGFIIPVSSVFTSSEKLTYVWVVDEQTMTVKRREVKTGEMRDQGIEIVNGLIKGEWVVTAGVNTLQEGQQASILGQEVPEAEEEYEPDSDRD